MWPTHFIAMSYTVCLEEEPDRLSLVANVLSVVTFAIAIVVPLQYYARPTSDINQVIEALDSGLAHEYELVLHQMRKIQELNLPGNIIAVTSGRPWAETLQESSDLLTEASDKLWRSSKAGSRFWRIVFLVRHDENVELAKKAKCKQLRKMSEIDNDE